MTEKIMKLVNPLSGEMECRVCGATVFSDTRPLLAQEFYLEDWQCPNGCRLEDW